MKMYHPLRDPNLQYCNVFDEPYDPTKPKEPSATLKECVYTLFSATQKAMSEELKLLKVCYEGGVIGNSDYAKYRKQLLEDLDKVVRLLFVLDNNEYLPPGVEDPTKVIRTAFVFKNGELSEATLPDLEGLFEELGLSLKLVKRMYNIPL